MIPSVNGARDRLTIEQAIEKSLDDYNGYPWVRSVYWPQASVRFQAFANELTRRSSPNSESARILDVGCFEGLFCVMLRHLGYEVTGCDMEPSEARDASFRKYGIGYQDVDLNEPNCLRGFQDGQFNAVILAEVIEHVLNHPLGVIRECARVLRPGGLLFLTTPNPSTVMNAVRVLRGQTLLWGDEVFVDEPKAVNGRFNSVAHVHYREFTTAQLRRMVESAGFEIDLHRYYCIGANPTEPRYKRMLKRTPWLGEWLTSHRMLGSTHYVVARRRDR